MSYNYAILNRRARCVKIGYSESDPEGRLRSLQTGSPDPLELLGFWEGTKEDEASHHRWMEPYRRQGEWFALSRPVVRFLRERTLIDLSSLVPQRPTIKAMVNGEASVSVCPLTEDHRAKLLTLDTVSPCREVIDRYGLPRLGTLSAHARSAAEKYGVSHQRANWLCGYKASGEPQYREVAVYPAWCWLAGWITYAQFRLDFSYEEAWALIERQVLNRPASDEDAEVAQSAEAKSALHAEVASLKETILALEKQNADLREENQSLSQTLHRYQERFIHLRELAKQYYRMDLFDESLPVVIGRQRARLVSLHKEVKKYARAFESLRAVFDRIQQCSPTKQ